MLILFCGPQYRSLCHADYGDGRVCVMLTFSMVVVVVWESREQPAAALNQWCTEYWGQLAVQWGGHWVQCSEWWGEVKVEATQKWVLYFANSFPTLHIVRRGVLPLLTRKILPKKLQIGIPPYRHDYENFCATRPKWRFWHKSHLALAKNSQICWALFLRTKCSAKRDSPLHHINFCNTDINIETTFTY